MNNLNMDWQIARYRFEFVVTECIGLPEYAGSMLRGAFGRVLRKISCMTKQKDCKSCPLYRSCPYPAIFETPAPEDHPVQNFSQVPNGYVIEPPEWGVKVYEVGETLCFNLVLFGRLLEQLPLIAFAWQRAFQHQVGKGKAELANIWYCNPLEKHESAVYFQGKIEPHQPSLSLPTDLPSHLQLQLTTPMRIQRNGHPLSATEITLERVIVGLAKRLVLLSEFHSTTALQLDFEELKQQIDNISDHKQLRWRDWTRFSSRQQQTMQLGGLVGEWQFEQVSPLVAQLLYLGQWLHVGKNASFGLGKYYITNL